MAQHADDASKPAHDAETQGEHHGVGHVVPVKYLTATGVALLVLTVVTVEAARFDFGAANVFIALLIAVLKASLVVLFFMHLRWDRPFNGIVFVTSIAFVAMFIGFALTDTFEYRRDVEQYREGALSSYLRDVTPAPEARKVKDRLMELQQQATASSGEDESVEGH